MYMGNSIFLPTNWWYFSVTYIISSINIYIFIGHMQKFVYIFTKQSNVVRFINFVIFYLFVQNSYKKNISPIYFIFLCRESNCLTNVYNEVVIKNHRKKIHRCYFWNFIKKFSFFSIFLLYLKKYSCLWCFIHFF